MKKYMRIVKNPNYKKIKELNGHKCHHTYGMENADKTIEYKEFEKPPKGWKKVKRQL